MFLSTLASNLDAVSSKSKAVFSIASHANVLRGSSRVPTRGRGMIA